MANKIKLIEQVKTHLSIGEQAIISIKGIAEDNKEVLFTATNKNLVLYKKRLTGYDIEVFPYDKISSFNLGKSFMGNHLSFLAPGKKITLKWIKDTDFQYLVTEAQNRIGNPIVEAVSVTIPSAPSTIESTPKVASTSAPESNSRGGKGGKIFLIIFLSIIGLSIIAGMFPPAETENTISATQLTILEPENETSIQSSTTTLKGSVEPANLKVSINSSPVSVDENGNFKLEVQLPEETNNFSVAAYKGTGGKSVTKNISIKRIFSPEELLERAEAEEQLKIKIEKEKALVEAKEKAELEAYNNSKAGKLCAKYPNWSKQECQQVADRKIWIGMTREMLVAMNGLPDHANPSNYGGVTEWQWCWNDLTPSCFYDKNGDGAVDSYN